VKRNRANFVTAGWELSSAGWVDDARGIDAPYHFQEISMLNPTRTLVLATAAVVAAAMVTAPASAEDGRNGAFAAGAAAGVVGGALLGGVARPAYGSERVYVEPECRWTRARFYDGYRYRVRRVQVCN
jgi:hypothetical protein